MWRRIREKILKNPDSYSEGGIRRKGQNQDSQPACRQTGMIGLEGFFIDVT